MTACLLVSPVLAAPPMWRVASQPSRTAPGDRNPDGPRPASRGARVRNLTIIRFMTVITLRGLGPGRGRFRPRGARVLVRRSEIGKGLVEQGQDQKIQMEMSKEQKNDL